MPLYITCFITCFKNLLKKEEQSGMTQSTLSGVLWVYQSHVAYLFTVLQCVMVASYLHIL